jgi:hypothetical protein
LNKPNLAFPDNLPYPVVTWDRDIREYCLQNGMVYSPWGMLWGSLDDLDGPEKILDKAGQKLGFSKEVACYALMRSLRGCQISLLCGTSNEDHMRETLAGLAKVKRYLAESEEHRKTWKGYVDRLKIIVDGDELVG